VTITDPAKLEFFLQVRKSFIAFTGPTKFEDRRNKWSTEKENRILESL
jgi:hypothetical protein